MMEVHKDLNKSQNSIALSVSQKAQSSPYSRDFSLRFKQHATGG